MERIATPLALSVLLTLVPVQDAQGAQVVLAAQAPSGAVDERARYLWDALVEAARPRATGAQRAAVTAFDLAFDGRLRSGDKQQNDFDNARYRFRAPGWVRTTMENGVERMRGPEGDWLIDRAKKDKVQLVGRDFAEDRREIGETLDIARNFVALTDPARLTVRGMRMLPAPPASLPRSLGDAAGKLDWLEIESPDFRLTRSQSTRPDAVFRAQLGLDRATHLPRIAVVFEAAGSAMNLESALLVEFDSYERLDDFQVPYQLRTYPVLPPTDAEGRPRGAGPVFAERWELGIWLKRTGASLRPKLGPEDFVPPARL